MRLSASMASPKLPAGQGSICTLSKSSIPRFSHGGSPCRVATNGVDGPHGLLEQKTRPHVFELLPATHLAGGDRHGHLGQVARRIGDDYKTQLALDSVAGFERPDALLVGLVQSHICEPSIIGQSTGSPHRLDSKIDLVRSDRREGMIHQGGHRCRSHRCSQLPARRQVNYS